MDFKLLNTFNTPLGFVKNLSFCVSLSLLSISSYALEAIDDSELSEATGEGIAIIAEKFSLKMDDTAYIRLTSRGGDAVTTGKKADIYAYGLKVGGSDGTNGRGVNATNLGTVNNPAILRVFKTGKVPVSDPDIGSGADLGKDNIDVMQIRLATREDNAADYSSEESLKLSTWVDLIGRDGVVYNDTVTNNANDNRTRLGVILDKFSLNGTKIQTWKAPGSSENPDISGKTAISGLVRLNSAETGGLRITSDLATDPSPTQTNTTNSSNARYGDASVTTAPVFGADNGRQEGIYWKNFDLNMPLGALGYQPVVISSGGDNDRELTLEIARLPNNPSAYNAAYIDYSNQADIDAKTCRSNSCPQTATHATLSFQLQGRLADGSLEDTSSRYYGAGLGSIDFTDPVNNNAVDGAAGIGVATQGAAFGSNLGRLNSLPTAVSGPNGTGSYSKIDGLFVQHLKLTTNAF